MSISERQTAAALTIGDIDLGESDGPSEFTIPGIDLPDIKRDEGDDKTFKTITVSKTIKPVSAEPTVNGDSQDDTRVTGCGYYTSDAFVYVVEYRLVNNGWQVTLQYNTFPSYDLTVSSQCDN